MDPGPLEPGQIIDGCPLEAPIKPGGMANLWHVTHPEHGAHLVMKLPFVRRGENPLAIIGFEVEGMILPRLTGEHAPRFVKSGDFSNPYIVMEFVAGRSLKDRLELQDRKSTRLNSSHLVISYAVFCLKKKKTQRTTSQPSRMS